MIFSMTSPKRTNEDNTPTLTSRITHRKLSKWNIIHIRKLIMDTLSSHKNGRSRNQQTCENVKLVVEYSTNSLQRTNYFFCKYFRHHVWLKYVKNCS